jgi:hypothetical protein
MLLMCGLALPSMLLVLCGLRRLSMLLLRVFFLLCVFLMLCVGGSSGSEKQRQNCCADDSNYFH